MSEINKKLVQFGAGNIGRSFIGQVFSQIGYEVVFIDVDNSIISAINEKHQYTVIVKSNNAPDIEQKVTNVRAVHSADTAKVIQEIASADLISTSVGKNAIPKIIPAISSGILTRYQNNPDKNIDLIIAENIHDGAEFFTEELRKNLPADFQIENFIGLIETSIGKSVPTMTKEELREDPLRAFAEPYNLLILSGNNLKNPLPASENIKLVKNIKAYVDRKLFIHNLGHASAAYFGYTQNPETVNLSDVLEDENVKNRVKACMLESAAALCAEYPDEFTEITLNEHVDDLVNRFGNKALKDTVFRVGRDLFRKLNENDRLIGAVNLCRKHKLPYNNILNAIAAGMNFKAVDENGDMFESDKLFNSRLENEGIDSILKEVCGLTDNMPEDRDIAATLKDYFKVYKR